MCKIIYDKSQIEAFVDIFFGSDRNPLSWATASLFIKASKTLENTVKTRLVRNSLTAYNSNLGKVDPEAFISDIEKLSSRKSDLVDEVTGESVKIENLAIYANVNVVLYKRALANLARGVTRMVADRIVSESASVSDLNELSKFLLGKGKVNGIIQESVDNMYHDYDIDLPDVEKKRKLYNLNLIKFFDRILDGIEYHLISTKGGYHLITKNKNLKFVDKMGYDTLKRENPRLMEFYKELVPNGTQKVMNLDLINELLPIYLGIDINQEDERGHKIYEFVEANDGCPLPGTLQKGYKVKIIK